MNKKIRKAESLTAVHTSNHSEKGITLIALVVTMIVPYDKNLKHSNINRFHYLQYIKNNKKIENMIKMSLKTCLFLYLK